MNTIQHKIIVPEDLIFSDLKLSRKETGEVEFDWAPIERICEESGLDVKLFRDTHEENVISLIHGWYEKHIERGGEVDPVFEDLTKEVLLEDQYGSSLSYTPGRA